MSLINDALRRANQQQKNAPTPESSDGAPMQPVPSSHRQNPSFFGPMLLIFLLGVVLTCASWFFWKAWSAKSKASLPVMEIQTPAPVATENTVAIPSPMIPSVPQPTALEATEINPPAAAVEPSPEKSPATNATTITEVALPTPPPLRLQGIFYRISNPTALINGKTVAIGERVDGARVLKIDRQEVTLERNGESIVLTLD